MKIFKCICSVILSAALTLGAGVPIEAVTNENGIVANIYSGEASADAWTAAVTVMHPDRSLFTEDNMVRIDCISDDAPYFVMSSLSGGAEWVMITPSNVIDGDYYYSYEDMVKGFGADMSLLDYVSVMAQNAPVTVYSIDVVTAESVNDTEDVITGENRVVGYLPDWSYQAYKEMDFSALTHLNIAFCNPDTNGNISCYIPDSEMHAIVDKAHANGVKVLAALGGGGGCDNYPPLVSTTEAMNSFNEKIMAYCEKYNLDGIDLDIELGSNNSIWNNYAEWCKSLRELCDERDMLMTTATAQWVAVHVKAETFGLFDFVNVMAYDNEADPQSHSTYEFAVECLKYFNVQRSIPKDKLVLGVPFYGRGYNADGSLDWGSYVAFSELIEADTANYSADNYNGVAYTGSETMKKKCTLSKTHGGIMIWELSLDAKGEYSMLRLIKDELSGKTKLVGDINYDGAADDKDLILLRNYLLMVEEFTEEQYIAADLNADGSVDSLDLCSLRAILAA